MGILVLILLAFQSPLTAQAPDPATQTCLLSGTIVDSISGTPVSKAALSLSPANGSPGERSITSSDENGKFALSGLKPGQYRLNADRTGYVQMHYSAHGSDTTIRLVAGQTVENVRFRLTPAGSIAGTVRDSDGDAVEGAQVELSRTGYDHRGRLHLLYVNLIFSDDRGEYRFHGLAPGKYFVSASGDRSQSFLLQQSQQYGAIDRTAGHTADETDVLTFYPNSPDTTAAQTVTASAGKHIEGIDIQTIKKHAVCVAGRVENGESGEVRLRAEPKGANGISGVLRATAHARGTDGTFRFCGVPSGSYIASAVSLGASVERSFEVGPVDVNDLRLSPEPLGSIEIHVTSEGDKNADLSNFLIHIFYESGTERTAFDILNGTRKIDRWSPGRYDVEARPLPQGWYVKSIRSGDRDVLTDGLTVPSGGASPLDITLSPYGSSLSGMVLDKDQQPVPGATVLAAPLERTRYDLFAHVAADQQGHYEFDALTPGSYILYALDDVEADAWNDPDFLRPYEKQAVKVDLDPKGKATIDLKAAIASDRQ